MTSTWMRLLTVCVLCCLLLVGCDGGGNANNTREALPVTGELTVAVLQVGKADAIVLHTANHAMLIDTGEIDDGGKVLNYMSEQGISRIDAMLITHYDRDHVGGADRIMRFAEVGQVIRPDYTGEREEYETLLSDITELGVTDTVMPCGGEDLTFMLGDAKITVNAPAQTAYTNADGSQLDNEFSLVTTVQHGSRVMLFTGDCMDTRLAELIKSGADLSADFLKVPYHGNYTQLTASFMQKVRPAYAVVCDSAKNPVDEETLKALGSAKVYETRAGTVICRSDGAALTVTQQPEDE